jgi:hypothetical protein
MPSSQAEALLKGNECLMMRLSPSNRYKLVISSWNKSKKALSNHQVSGSSGAFRFKLKEYETDSWYDSLAHLLDAEYFGVPILDTDFKETTFAAMFPSYKRPRNDNMVDSYLSEVYITKYLD